ncbi:MAG: hypothetical protein ACRC6A_12595 [Fusobacteriaceae bacterium]
MILRNEVVRNVLRQLGEVEAYNANTSDIYNYVQEIFNDVLDHVAYRVDFKFNSTTVKLTSVGKNELDENKFNLPIDFLNKLTFVDVIGRIEGEFVYSDSAEVFLRYCRKIDLSEYPDYMKSILVLLTALRVAESYNTYSDRVQLLNTRAEEEITRIYNIEFQPKTRTY